MGERCGAEVALGFKGLASEYMAVREAVGLTDFSFTVRCKVPEAGLDVLERYAAGSVANIRFGRVLHTLSANERGFVESDVYIANDDEQLLLIGESLVGGEAVMGVLEGLGGKECGVEDISGSTALFGVDGVRAWAVVKELFGPDVLGLPYLSIETYGLEGHEVKLLRAGKTSEFGYLLLVPADGAAAVWERVVEAGGGHGLEQVGMEAHDALRLDGRFFNIHAEGAKVGDPLELGLQWMMDFRGEAFRGKEAIMARRAAGVKRKIIGVAPEEGELWAGAEIMHEGRVVAEVVTACCSPTLRKWIGLALFERELAYSGLTFEDRAKRKIHTISMPPFMPQSLSIKLDEM